MVAEEWDTPTFITVRAARAFLSALSITIQEMDQHHGDFDFARLLEGKLAAFDADPETGPEAMTAQDKGDLLFLRQRLNKNVDDARELASIVKSLE